MILGMLAVLLVVARVLPRLLGFPKAEQGMVNVMTVFTNIGFMGVPMIDGIYGKDALIYMTLLLIPFNLLFFSYSGNVLPLLELCIIKKPIVFPSRVWH